MVVKWSYDYADETARYVMIRHGKKERHRLRKKDAKKLIVNEVIHKDSMETYKSLYRCIKLQIQGEDVKLICRDHHGMYRHFLIRYHYICLGSGMLKVVGVAIAGDLLAEAEENVAL